MVSRRQVLGSLTGIGLLGGGAGAYSLARRPEVIFNPDAHRGETVRHSFTLNRRSYIQVISLFYGEMPWSFAIYRDGSPNEIMFLDSTGYIDYYTGREAILDPGTYHVVVNNIPPEIKSTQFHYFREADSHGTVSVSEYLDAISLFADANNEVLAPSPSLLGVFSPHEYYSDHRIIGLERGEEVFITPGGISIKGQKEQPKAFARQLVNHERLIQPQVEEIGGAVKERYNRIIQRNRRILPPMYVYEDLPDLYQSTGLTRTSYVGLLTALIDDSDLQSAVSDAQSGAGPSTGVNAYWYQKPGQLADESTATVPVGLKFTIDHTEVAGVEEPTLVYSPMIGLPATRTETGPAVWEIETGVVGDALTQLEEAITSD